ncbi:MAG: YtxH domain-containing protein [Polyangiales bacterium]
MSPIQRLKKQVPAVAELTRDDILAQFGLEMRRSGLSRAFPLVGATLAGVAIGVGIGVLFAPVSGEEARAAIREKSQDYVARAKSQFSSTPVGKSSRATKVNGASAHS